MKILELKVEGFRSFKNTVWKPGDLNVVIGRNGSGKSNLLKLLELISASAKGDLDDYVTSSGGMNALLWDGQVDQISINLASSALGYPYDNPNVNILNYEVKLRQIGKSSNYRVENEELVRYEIVNQTTFQLLQRTTKSGKLFSEKQSPSTLEAAEKTIKEGETLLSTLSSPFLQAFRQIASYREQLDSWAVYQDIKTARDSKMREAVEVRAVNQVSADGQNLINVLHTLYESPDNPDFKERVDDAMRAAFGDDFQELKFSPDANGRVQMGIRWKQLRRVNFGTVLSDGTLRFLFLLTVLANPAPPALIAIDEPEVGLHPSMLPIIAELATDAATRTQVVLTTHSPQFLSAFDKDSPPTTTITSWRNGETVLTNLEGERLSYWLEQYSLGELFDSGDLENMATELLEKV